MAVTDKIAVSVTGDPRLFEQVSSEALRLDRSVSWVFQRCLQAVLGGLAELPPDDERVGAVTQRAPDRSQVLTVYLPREMHGALDAQSVRLGLAAGEILIWAWQKAGPAIRALPAV